MDTVILWGNFLAQHKQLESLNVLMNHLPACLIHPGYQSLLFVIPVFSSVYVPEKLL